MLLGGDRGGSRQSVVANAAFSRQKHELDPLPACQPREFFHSVLPAIVTAENADEDEPCPRRRLVEPEIHRHGVAKLAQVDGAERDLPLIGPGCRNPVQIAAGKRQHRHIRRRLIKVDRLDEVVERRRCGGEDVHDFEALGGQHPFDCGTIDALLANYDEAALPCLAGFPDPVEIMIHA